MPGQAGQGEGQSTSAHRLSDLPTPIPGEMRVALGELEPGRPTAVSAPAETMPSPGPCEPEPDSHVRPSSPERPRASCVAGLWGGRSGPVWDEHSKCPARRGSRQSRTRCV